MRRRPLAPPPYQPPTVPKVRVERCCAKCLRGTRGFGDLPCGLSRNCPCHQKPHEAWVVKLARGEFPSVLATGSESAMKTKAAQLNWLYQTDEYRAERYDPAKGLTS